MRRVCSRAAAAFSLTVLLASPALSQQQVIDALRVSEPGNQFSARALGLGNAYSTIGYDFSALRFNPATMGVSDRFSWSVTVNADAFGSKVDYYGAESRYKTTNAIGGQIGLTIPFMIDSTRHLVFGLGYTQSKDFNQGYKYEGLNAGTKFPSFIEGLAGQNDPTARALGLTFPTIDGDQTVLGSGMFEKGFLLGQGGLTHFSFGVAVEPANNVYFGASGSYNSGHLTNDLQLTANDVNDAYGDTVHTVPGDPNSTGFVSADYHAVRDKQYRGWDGRFGVLYKFWDIAGISASFELPSRHQVSEDDFTSGRSQFSVASLVSPELASSTTYYFRPPAQITMGGMVNTGIVQATAEATYIDYTAMTVTSGAGSVTNEAEINRRIKEEMIQVLNLNAGAEMRLPFTGLSGRVGGIYQPVPFKGVDELRYAQKYVTLGVGLNSENMIQFDIGYAYGWRGELKDPETGQAKLNDQTIVTHTVLLTMRVAL